MAWIYHQMKMSKSVERSVHRLSKCDIFSPIRSLDVLPVLPTRIHRPAELGLISLVGGKRQIVDKIFRFAPSCAEVVCVPFSGAFTFGLFAAKFYKKRAGVRRIIMSDVYEPLTNLAEVVRKDAFHFASRLNFIRERYSTVSMQMFEDAIDVVKSSQAPFERAIAYYLYNAFCWPPRQFHLQNAGYTPSRENKMLSSSRLRRIPAIGEILLETEIYNEDYRQTLERAAVAERRALIILDPPYIGRDVQLYGSKFDHVALRHAMENTHCRFMMTLDASPTSIEAYSHYCRAFYYLRYSRYAGKRGSPRARGVEQLIMNYTPEFFDQRLREVGWSSEDDFLAKRPIAAR